MRLEVNGEGRVCAGDIATSADFEIVNPELHLATLDSNDASLAVEFNVEPGTGYEPALSADGLPGMPIGVLPVDAIYNPVRKVNYLTEKSRVGNATNYERLVLEVWTDGTITPADVVRRSSEILVTHFFLFSGLGRSTSAQEERSISVPPEIYQMPIEKLQLSPRTLNCLKRAHMSKVGQVLETPDDELLKIRNFGEKSLEELKAKIQELGLDGSGPLRADALVAPGEKGPEWRSAYGDLDDDDLPVGFTGERTAVADGIEDDDEEDYFDEDEDDEPAVRATPRPVAEEGLPDEAPNEDDYDKEGC
jgi:DNA-directed RNA polymerase alpha subunit